MNVSKRCNIELSVMNAHRMTIIAPNLDRVKEETLLRRELQCLRIRPCFVIGEVGEERLCMEGCSDDDDDVDGERVKFCFQFIFFFAWCSC